MIATPGAVLTEVFEINGVPHNKAQMTQTCGLATAANSEAFDEKVARCRWEDDGGAQMREDDDAE